MNNTTRLAANIINLMCNGVIAEECLFGLIILATNVVVITHLVELLQAMAAAVFVVCVVEVPKQGCNRM